MKILVGHEASHARSGAASGCFGNVRSVASTFAVVVYLFEMLTGCEPACPPGTLNQAGTCKRPDGSQTTGTVSSPNMAAAGTGVDALGATPGRPVAVGAASGSSAPAGAGSSSVSNGVPSGLGTGNAGTGSLLATAGNAAQQSAGAAGAAGQSGLSSGVAGSAGATGGAATAASKCPPGQTEESEMCDGLDNDCDGSIDEKLIEECGSSSMEPCHKGMKTCSAGMWGECIGAVEPLMEVCDAARVDEDCDGAVNEGCQCTEGEAVACGKSGGICKQGMQQCKAGQLTPCSGSVDPSREVCDGSLDEDCDGKTDEGCECTNGEQGPCMPAGACAPGMRSCREGKWGQCTGATVCASDKICNVGRCVDCIDNATRKCGKSLPSPCRQGTQTCRGGRWDTQCVDEKGPTEDVCNGIDDNCDGKMDNGCPSGQQCVMNGSAQKCSAPLPNGSYRNSCDDCTYDGSTLSCAKCQTGSGGASSSSLSQRCASGQGIANCYGTLGCRDTELTVRSGSYSKSCMGCFYDECQLHCTSCENGTGGNLDSTTKDFPCSVGIANCLGRLMCGGC